MTPPNSTAAEPRLSSGADLADAVERLVATHGRRVGLEGLLSEVDRRAFAVEPPTSAAAYGFRFGLLDSLTLRWWPQGITTSADASEVGAVAGRELVVVSWYAKSFRGRSPGVRLSFVDVTDRSRPTYASVLLVEPVSDGTGRVEARPVRVHAGGIVWFGPSIWVADTYGGFRLFDVADLVRASGAQMAGHRYLLPQRTTYSSVTDERTERFRFSFVSVDRSGAVPWLMTGEYGDAASTRRVARFRLDAVTGRLAVGEGCSRPVKVVGDGPVRMQGVVGVRDREYLSTSNGRWRRGHLWTRDRGAAACDRGALLAVGPEDLSYWPEHDELWNVSEHPLRRQVYAIPRAQFD